MAVIYDDSDRDENEDDADDAYRSDSFDDDPDVVPCPYCKAEISELADVCPKCRNFISREDAPPERKPVWFVLVVVLLILSFIGLGVFAI